MKITDCQKGSRIKTEQADKYMKLAVTDIDRVYPKNITLGQINGMVWHIICIIFFLLNLYLIYIL